MDHDGLPRRLDVRADRRQRVHQGEVDEAPDLLDDPHERARWRLHRRASRTGLHGLAVTLGESADAVPAPRRAARRRARHTDADQVSGNSLWGPAGGGAHPLLHLHHRDGRRALAGGTAAAPGCPTSRPMAAFTSPPTVCISSAKWHATVWPGPNSRKAGSSVAQRSGLPEALAQPAAGVEAAAGRRVRRRRDVALEHEPLLAFVAGSVSGSPTAAPPCTGAAGCCTARRRPPARPSARGTSPRPGR